MDTLEEKIGYLVAKMEEVGEQIDKVDRRLSTLEDTVTSKFHTAEVTFKVLKFIGLGILAIISFKFGDVSRLWTHFFG